MIEFHHVFCSRCCERYGVATAKKQYVINTSQLCLQQAGNGHLSRECGCFWLLLQAHYSMFIGSFPPMPHPDKTVTGAAHAFTHLCGRRSSRDLCLHPHGSAPGTQGSCSCGKRQARFGRECLALGVSRRAGGLRVGNSTRGKHVAYVFFTCCEFSFWR